MQFTQQEQMDMHKKVHTELGMNFENLTQDQAREFLIANGIDVGKIQEGLLKNKSEILFYRLYQEKANTFTHPYADLYIASQLKRIMKSEYLYHTAHILNADMTTLRQFANIMDIPMDRFVRERIIRILDFMEVLVPMTMGDLIDGGLDQMTIYYEIITDTQGKIDKYTVTNMHLHFDRGLYSLVATKVEIEEDEGKTFIKLNFSIKPEDFEGIEERTGDPFLESRTTDDTMIKAFGGNKVSIPYSFTEDVVFTGLTEAIKSEFRFSHIESEDLRIPVYIHVKN